MEMYRIRSDPSAARAFVDFHVGRQIVMAENIYDGKTVETFASGKILRLQCVQNEFGVEGRRIHFQTVRGYNGAVHAVDHVLYPPTISVEDLIRKNESFRYKLYINIHVCGVYITRIALSRCPR